MFSFRTPEKRSFSKEIKPTKEITQFKEIKKVLVQPEFEEIRYIFFDLNDTLHDFHKTEEIALEAVYNEIKKYYELERDEFKNIYRKEREQHQKEGFIQEKSGFEYRSERFRKVLKHFSIDDENLTKKLVEVYTSTFEQNLRIEKNVLSTLRDLSEKYTLVLVTEGPIDTQYSMIKSLGLEDYFPYVFISAKYKKAKHTGELFKQAIKELDLDKKEIVIIGDSLEKDIQGANKIGVKSILGTFYSKNKKSF